MDRFEQLRREFADFDISTLPAIPDDWADASWHNDACPRFCVEVGDKTIDIFIAEEAAAEREYPDGTRYSVQLSDSDGTNILLDTDDFDAVKAKVAEIRS